MSLPTSLFLSHHCTHPNFKKFAEGKKAQVEGNMLALHRLDGQLTVYIIEIFRYFFTGGQKFGAQPQSPCQGFRISKGNSKACFARAKRRYMVRRAIYEVVNATYL